MCLYSGLTVTILDKHKTGKQSLIFFWSLKKPPQKSKIVHKLQHIYTEAEDRGEEVTGLVQ